MAILTRAQLIEALGGDASAAQLLPDRATGDIDYTKLDGAISDAIGDCEAALGSRYQNESATPSAKMVRIARQLGTYYAWGRAGNKAMPELVKQLYGAARQDLRDIENSASKPGESSETRFGSYIDNGGGGSRWTYGNLRHAGILGRR